MLYKKTTILGNWGEILSYRWVEAQTQQEWKGLLSQTQLISIINLKTLQHVRNMWINYSQGLQSKIIADKQKEMQSCWGWWESKRKKQICFLAHKRQETTKTYLHRPLWTSIRVSCDDVNFTPRAERKSLWKCTCSYLTGSYLTYHRAGMCGNKTTAMHSSVIAST